MGPGNAFAYECVLDTGGVHMVHRNTRVTVRWPGVHSVGVLGDYVELQTDNHGVVVVPKRAFDNPGEINRFTSYAQFRITEGLSQAGSDPTLDKG